MIPVASPVAAYQRYRAELDAAWQRVMSSGRYILGPEVEAFEAEFAAQCGAGVAVGVANGTEAIWLALRAAGLQPGDEVLVPSLTASATAAAIVECGAVPVFADVRPSDLTLDPARLDEALTPRTRAVVAVHLYGNPADASGLQAFCQAHGLALIEDCAQAHGAQHAGRPVGTFGLAAAWSFYPTKNLGAFGDGGLVTTSDPAVAERLRLLREYGWRERYHSDVHGWNSRLDELQAALLRVRLAHLEEDNQRRRAIARLYRQALPAELRSPAAASGDVGVEHLFVIRYPRRDGLRRALAEAGVGTAIQYPVPCHLQRAYQGFGAGPGSLPVTEQAVREILSLPMYPELSSDTVEQVIAAVHTALREV
jgi:dTDP-3-amino-3,4,6-trideoxy-alpha-D-glucose transaminase